MDGRRAGDPPLLVAANAALLEHARMAAAHDDIDTIVGDALAWERKLGRPNLQGAYLSWRTLFPPHLT